MPRQFVCRDCTLQGVEPAMFAIVVCDWALVRGYSTICSLACLADFKSNVLEAGSGGSNQGEICLKIIMISLTQAAACMGVTVPRRAQRKQDARVTVILSSFSMYQKGKNPRNRLCFLLFGDLARTLNVNFQRNGGLLVGGGPNQIAL